MYLLFCGIVSNVWIQLIHVVHSDLSSLKSESWVYFLVELKENGVLGEILRVDFLSSESFLIYVVSLYSS